MPTLDMRESTVNRLAGHTLFDGYPEQNFAAPHRGPETPQLRIAQQ
jgi:hypothetical protein